MPSPLDSSAPVFVPEASELFYDNVEWEKYLSSLDFPRGASDIKPKQQTGNAFMDAFNSTEPTLPENRIFTDKGAVTHESTTNPLLDLFTELERTVSGERLADLLDAAWAEDPLSTLKIIWNARSIHLGKSDKEMFYKCCGWLREHHPLTLIANLEWAVKPVIEKKAPKKAEEGMNEVGGDAVVVEEGGVEDDETEQWIVKHGLSHGYYCDLLNILTLAVNGTLDVTKSPRETLQIQTRHKEPTQAKLRGSRRRQPKRAEYELSDGEEEVAQHERTKQENIDRHYQRGRDQKKAAKELKHKSEKEAHDRFLDKFTNDTFYRAFHLHVARLFASAIERDTQLLASGKEKNFKEISLAAKWAPSAQKQADRHTFIASTIGELLFPPSKINTVQVEESREVYLKYAREHYRRATASLRKALDVVEIKITAKRIGEIDYSRVPSLAMDRYKKQFATKDLQRFEAYLEDVAAGKTNISGAVLLPSQLVTKVFEANQYQSITSLDQKGSNIDQLVKAKISQIEAKVVDQQWNTLCQRIQDSGTLDNAIAVADVSGSMGCPVFADGTCPMSSSVGLSLLVAKVAKPPFNNSFITFSAQPKVVKLDPNATFSEQVQAMQTSEWGMTTDFNAVFEKLLLPMAIQNKIPKEEMIKRIFVFSDMQFDAARHGNTVYRYSSVSDEEPAPAPPESWETNYERIKRLYEEAGYEVPQLVFWNLAGGRYDGIAPKPVTAETNGTALVSGYSQAMLKVFLDGGGFEDPEDEEELVEVEMGDGDNEPRVKKGEKFDPLSIVKKAIGHRSYGMLKIVD